jgi:hypothetical protein
MAEIEQSTRNCGVTPPNSCKKGSVPFFFGNDMMVDAKKRLTTHDFWPENRLVPKFLRKLLPSPWLADTVFCTLGLVLSFLILMAAGFYFPNCDWFGEISVAMICWVFLGGWLSRSIKASIAFGAAKKQGAKVNVK